MKLNVFLLTDDPINDLTDLPSIDEHYNWIILRKNAVSTYSKLSSLIRKYKPVAFCTVGVESEWRSMFSLPYEYKKHWVHFSSMKDITSCAVEHCYMDAITTNRFSKSSPLFSVISTTFHSGEKIFRPYNSLKGQTYSNWEWVIWDDSKEDHNDIWNKLLEFQNEDVRINCYRAPQHSGYIGEMKWRSASLCKGEWIVEVDHDDIIDPRLFQWCREAVEKYPDTDFICSNCIELHEDDEEPFKYGDGSAFGHVGYHKEWLRGKWHNVYHVPHMNPTTIRYIVGMPNHVRIWRRSFYEKIGRHNPYLPVVDDYELLIRSYIEGNWVYIDAPTYFQYRNRGGNNFTFLRNSLIQHLTKKVCAHYDKEIDEFWKSKDIPNKYTMVDNKRVWELQDNFNYDRGFKTYMPNITPNTVSIVLTVENESEKDIIKTVDSIVKQDYTDWLIYIIGNKSGTLDKTMNTIRAIYGDTIISKIRWWNLQNHGVRQFSLNYAHRMLINTEWISYIEIGYCWKKDFLSRTFLEMKETNKQIYASIDLQLYNTVHHYSYLKLYSEFNNRSIKDIINKKLYNINNSGI